MSKWRKKQLQEIAFLKPTETLKKGDIAPNIPMANIKEFQRDVVKIDYGEFRGGTKFRNGDTLLAKITPCLENGKTAFVNCLQEDEIGFGSTEFIVLRAKENIDERFLYYLSISPEFRKQAISLMEGTSGRKRVNENALKISDFLIPDFEEQRKIANILSAIDDKIQINNQINQELEVMAKTLYDYWFVQFDFPDQNGKPYKSSGGKMVYNPELKREIPEGWGVEKLKYFLTIKNGKDHKNLQDGKFAVYGSGGIMRSVTDYLYSGESILFPRKGTLNNVMYVNEKFWTVDTMFYSEVNKNNSALYVFYSVKDIDFNKLNTGTGVPSMTSSILYDLNIIVPEENILEKFNTVVKRNYETIKLNNIQNQELIQLRDWLLPMLMNGQVYKRIEGKND